VQRCAADENFDHRIVRALRQRLPDLDIAEAYEAGLNRLPDPAVLAWAAAEGRVLLTHDSDTMIGYAYERLAAGSAMPGVVYVPWTWPIGRAVEDLLLLLLGSREDEWDGRVRFLPQ
jgi:hypothetical protein